MKDSTKEDIGNGHQIYQIQGYLRKTSFSRMSFQRLPPFVLITGGSKGRGNARPFTACRNNISVLQPFSVSFIFIGRTRSQPKSSAKRRKYAKVAEHPGDHVKRGRSDSFPVWKMLVTAGWTEREDRNGDVSEGSFSTMVESIKPSILNLES